MKKVLLYGDIDLNLIDGSAVWIHSLINVLTKNKGVKIDLLLKTKPINEEIIGEIKLNPQVELKYSHNKSRLSPAEAAKNIQTLNENQNYDFIFIRGNEVLKNLKKNKKNISNLWSYLIQIENLNDDELKNIVKKSNIIFVQTEEAKKSLTLRIDTNTNILILPPMVNDIFYSKKVFFNNSNKLIYQGKFSDEYNSNEILDAFKELVDTGKNIYLEVLGNKFNKCLSNPNFQSQVLTKLETYPYINWRGGIKKSLTEKIVESNDIGISWRKNSLNEIDEISTKLLEYGRCGKPVIMNRTKVHEKIFGKDYPLFANTKTEFKEKVLLAIENQEIYTKASKKMYKVSKEYTYTNIYESVFKIFLEKSEQRKNILFASHDFKFIDSMIDRFENNNYNVKLDTWDGHNIHNEKESKILLEWADIIICEWGLGNAVWYSNNKRSNQKLFVRVHSQEIRTEYPQKYNLGNINKIVTICPSIYETLNYKFNIPRENISLIYNFLDQDRLVNKKVERSINNFGMVGICPKMKRLDIAIDIFEIILEKNKKAKFFIKGKKPEEYQWLWNNKDEREYYEQILKKINSNKALKNAVIFDDFGKDMGKWYGKINFLLSTSDFEGSHQAVAESMMAGCIPIIRNWTNAGFLYPEKFIFSNVKEASKLIENFYIKNNSKKIGKENEKYAQINFDLKKIYEEWEGLILK